MDFTEKERSFLEELKSLFDDLKNAETGHLNSLEQIGMGTVPPINCEEKPLPSFTSKYKAMLCPEKTADMYLCTDVLSGEKQVSHLYDTATFEFRDQNVRAFLNHIQKEEQTHGKMIYDYMSANGMY